MDQRWAAQYMQYSAPMYTTMGFPPAVYGMPLTVFTADSIEGLVGPYGVEDIRSRVAISFGVTGWLSYLTSTLLCS
jgi:hypothetical protein